MKWSSGEIAFSIHALPPYIYSTARGSIGRKDKRGSLFISIIYSTVQLLLPAGAEDWGGKVREKSYVLCLMAQKLTANMVADTNEELLSVSLPNSSRGWYGSVWLKPSSHCRVFNLAFLFLHDANSNNPAVQKFTQTHLVDGWSFNTLISKNDLPYRTHQPSAAIDREE